MFKKLTTEDKLKLEKIKNVKLVQKQIEIEEALFDIAEIVSKEVEDEKIIL